MKKLVLATALTAAMFAGNVMATPNTETSGKVSFEGKVVEQTCKVQAGSRDLVVTLPTIAKNALNAEGKTATPTGFQIVLSGCTTGTASSEPKKVKAFFSSITNVDSQKNYTLKNTATGGAKDVHIQLFNADGATPIAPGKQTSKTNSNKVTYTFDDGVKGVDITVTPTLSYVAKYYAASSSVGVGKVQSSVDFELAYE